ncbi:MAG: hypothetical protein GXY83_23095 [Rhodopirellula sp.]|nr:hypothetical protein [Rhodopirellula sp.]
MLVSRLEAERARAELHQTCDDAQLVARQEAADMRNAIHDYRNWAETDRQRAEGACKDDAKERIERAEMSEARANRIEKELPAVEKAVAALEPEEAAIREQMLVP